MLTFSAVLLLFGLLLFLAGFVLALLQRIDRALAATAGGLFCWLLAELLRSGLLR